MQIFLKILCAHTIHDMALYQLIYKQTFKYENIHLYLQRGMYVKMSGWLEGHVIKVRKRRANFPQQRFNASPCPLQRRGF